MKEELHENFTTNGIKRQDICFPDTPPISPHPSSFSYLLFIHDPIFFFHPTCGQQGPNTSTPKRSVRYAQVTKLNALELSSLMKKRSASYSQCNTLRLAALDMKENVMDASFYEGGLARQDQLEEKKIPS
jgi:hypothetical protein